MSRLAFSLLRAVNNLRQSWLISAITMAIISVCLFLVGGYFLLILNIHNVISQWKTEVGITLYLREDSQGLQIDGLQDRMSALPEIQAVTFVSREAALDEFRAMLGREQSLLEGLTDSPLPASLRLIPKDEYRNTEGIRSILAHVGDDPLVEDVQYGREWLGRLEKALHVLYIGAILLGTAISLAAIFIIANTIKITVMARRDELEIMRLVGATEGFIRTPFLIEGIIQGMAGAVVSLGLLAIMHGFIRSHLSTTLFGTVDIGAIRFLVPSTMIAILMGGMLLGGLGSLASVGRFSR